MDRFGSLEAMRFAAALAAALFAWSGLTVWAGQGWTLTAALSIDFFLVLSGFFVARIYQDRLTNLNELTRLILLRVTRVYPILLLSLLAIFVMAILFAPSGLRLLADGGAAGLAAELSLLKAISPESATWNVAAWVISVEILMSLLFALFCVTRILTSMQGRLALALSVAGVVGYLSLNTASLNAFALDPALWVARGYAAFMAGALIYGFARQRPVVRSFEKALGAWGTLLEVATLGLLVLYLGWFASAIPAACALVFAAAVLVFQFNLGWISALFAGRSGRVTGAVAYPVLIIHGAIIWPIAQVSGGLDQQVRATMATPLFLGLLAALSVAAALYVERPTRDAMRIWLMRRFAFARADAGRQDRPRSLNSD